MSRVPLFDADGADPALGPVFERFAKEGREPIALYRALANAPQLLGAYSGLARAVRAEGEAALRETLTLRVAFLTDSDYEWSHHYPVALKAGVAEEKLAAIPDWRASELFDPRERAALACIDEVHENAVSDATFAELLRHFDSAEAVWIVTLGSLYELVARVVQGLGVAVEPDYEPYLRSE
jgi:4-carboxymuconolactone decarboxylase